MENMQNSSGMMNGMPPQPKTARKVGPIVGILIIVIILIVAAIYFFVPKTDSTAPVQNTQAVQTTPTNNTGDQTASVVAKSDDLATLEADLSAELKDIDYSF